jgi:pimeloyl-ACP methyl ester carboxylesterase
MLVLPGVPGPIGSGYPEFSSFASVPAYQTVNYTSSVDGTGLSYYEWLPPDYSNATAYPLAVYLHGLGYGGSEISTLSGGVSAITAAQADGFILISLNTRTGSGFYVNSPYTGPQQQDVLDAIAHEKSIRDVGKVYLFGSSMGSMGAYAIASQYPGLISGIGAAAECPDAYEAVYWHYLNIPGGFQSFLTTTGGNGPGTTIFQNELYNLSSARFYPQNFSAISVYATQGGNDEECPNNPNTFGYQQSNNTFLNSTCLGVAAWDEPANCQTPFANLSLAFPGEYRWRMVYTATGAHTLNEVNGEDMFGFWSGSVPPGLVCAANAGQTPGPCPTNPVTFEETGLPPGTEWNLTVDGTDYTSPVAAPVVVHLVSGPHQFSPAPPAGYFSSPPGIVVVLSSPITVNMTFAPIVYAVTFAESGLSSTSSWQVTLGNRTLATNLSAITIALTNGTYPFSVGPIAGYAVSAAATLTVNGSSVVVPVPFLRLTPFQVIFSETGLVAGSWNLTVDGSNFSSGIGISIALNLTNGTYAYVAEGPTEYVSPPSGNVTVAGVPLAVLLAFTPEPPSNVTFTEQGLPAGTAWAVTLNGTMASSTLPAIPFEVPEGQYAYSIGSVPGYLSSSGGVLMVDASSAQVVVPFLVALYNLTFDEVGLPPGAGWNVTIGPATLSTLGSSISWMLPNGTYAYRAQSSDSYHASNGSTTLQGAPATVSVSFAPNPTFAVSFHESGLPSQTTWGVDVNAGTDSGSGSSIVVLLPNGTFPFSFAAVPGYSAGSGGSITVAGSPEVRNVTFAKLTLYTVTFTETGLPSASRWGVTVGGSVLSATAKSVSTSLASGVYPYQVSPPPGYATSSTGSVTVSSSSQKVAVAFVLVKYAVTFTEFGLAAGTKWNVKVGSTSVSSTSSVVGFSLANGSYSYGVGSISGYARPANGSVSVSGAPVMISLVYVSAKTFAVKVTESGLPTGTSWSATFGTRKQSSTTTLITFNLLNGTYSYNLSASGYAAKPSGGSVAVNGKAISLKVSFGPVATPANPSVGTPLGWGVPAMTVRPGGAGGLPVPTGAAEASRYESAGPPASESTPR